MSGILRISIVVIDPKSPSLNLKENSIDRPAWARWRLRPSSTILPFPRPSEGRSLEDCDAEIRITPSAGETDKRLRFAYSLQPPQQDGPTRAVESIEVAIGIDALGTVTAAADSVRPGFVDTTLNRHVPTASHSYRWFNVQPLSVTTTDDGMQASAGVPHFFLVVIRNDVIPGFSAIDGESSISAPNRHLHSVHGDAVMFSITNRSGRTVTLKELPAGGGDIDPMTVIPFPGELEDGEMGTALVLLYPNAQRRIAIDDEDDDSDADAPGKAIVRFSADQRGKLDVSAPVATFTGNLAGLGRFYGTGLRVDVSLGQESWTDTGALVADRGIAASAVYPRPAGPGGVVPMIVHHRLVDIRVPGSGLVTYDPLPGASWFYRPVLDAAPGTGLAKADTVSETEPFVHRLNIVNQARHYRLRVKTLIEAAVDGTPIVLGDSYAPATILAPRWQSDDGESDDEQANGDGHPDPLTAFPVEIDAGHSVGLHLEHTKYLTSRSWISCFPAPTGGPVSGKADTVDIDLSLASFDGTPTTANPAVHVDRTPGSNLEYRYLDVLSNSDSSATDLDQRNSLVVVSDRPSQDADSPSKALLVVFQVAEPAHDEPTESVAAFVVDLLSTTADGDTALAAGRLDWEALDDDADGEATVESLLLMAIPGASPFGFSARLRVVDRRTDDRLLVFDVRAALRQGTSADGIFEVRTSVPETAPSHQVHTETIAVAGDYEVIVVLVTPADKGTPERAMFQTRLRAVRTGAVPIAASDSGGTNNTRSNGT